MKGIHMKFKIFALFFLIHALLGSARADDRLHLYLECSQGSQCINLAYASGKTDSVQATPALVLAGDNVKSAIVQTGAETQQFLELELGKEASTKLETVTGENIGKRLMVVFDNKILIAPTILEPIAGPKLRVGRGSEGQEPFWKRAPWLQHLIRDSYKESGRSVMVYLAIAIAVLISVFAFVLWSRIKRTSHSSPE
jgi:hypothetical protein